MIKQYLQNFETLCNKTSNINNGCGNTLLLARRQIDRIIENNILLHPDENVLARRKRQAVAGAAGLGMAAEATLYNFFNKHEMEKCNENIELLKTNEDHLLNLIKNHTLIF